MLALTMKSSKKSKTKEKRVKTPAEQAEFKVFLDESDKKPGHIHPVWKDFKEIEVPVEDRIKSIRHIRLSKPDGLKLTSPVGRYVIDQFSVDFAWNKISRKSIADKMVEFKSDPLRKRYYTDQKMYDKKQYPIPAICKRQIGLVAYKNAPEVLDMLKNQIDKLDNEIASGEASKSKKKKSKKRKGSKKTKKDRKRSNRSKRSGKSNTSENETLGENSDSDIDIETPGESPRMKPQKRRKRKLASKKKSMYYVYFCVCIFYFRVDQHFLVFGGCLCLVVLFANFVCGAVL